MANHDLHTSELISSALDGAASFSDLLNEFSALIGPAPSFDLLPPQICAFCHNILVNAITGIRVFDLRTLLLKSYLCLCLYKVKYKLD